MTSYQADDDSAVTSNTLETKAISLTWQYCYVVILIFFSAATILVVLSILARRRRMRKIPTTPICTPIERTPLLLPVAEKEIAPSPFFAYLGHNVITESIAEDPSNTSGHAIDRITEHIKVRNTRISNRTEEPQSYNFDSADGSVRTNVWRNFTYPDSPNRQLCVGIIETVHDSERERWRRKTLQFCGI